MTQAYQAALLQLQIEDLRRLKYSPTGGFAMFSLADPQPLASWSVLDHDREPKRGVLRGARRVPPGARDGRTACRTRARRQRHP